MAPLDSVESNSTADFQARQKSHPAQTLAQAIDYTTDAIQSCLNSKFQTLDKAVQQELCHFLILLRKIKRLSNSKKFQRRNQSNDELKLVVKNIAIACYSLENNGGLDFTAQIRADAESTIYRLSSPFNARISRVFNRFCVSASTPLKILVGLSLALPLYIGIPASMIIGLEHVSHTLERSQLISSSIKARSSNIPEIYLLDFREGTSLIILSFIAGATGSIISILSRISTYSDPKSQKELGCSFLPVFMGVFKPIIGGTFGVFVFALLNTSILDDFLQQPRTDEKWFTVISITFVSGFSERLAKDMIGKLEDKLTTSQPTTNATS